MKAALLAVAAGAVLLAAPVCAQEDAVKKGVDAYQRGDYPAAVAQWRAAAARGDADAEFNLGQAYKLGRGVPPDMKQAEEWYRKAALQGHDDAETYYGLAMFENGKHRDAVPWLERGVARGDARAQYVLGVMLFNGDSVEKDWVRAYALMVRASQTGLDAASKALAQMDQHVPLADRQKGSALARQYEQQYGSGGIALPPAPKTAAAPTRPAAPAPKPGRAPAPAPAPAAPARDGGWRVQLGAFGDPNNARKLWAQVATRFPGRQPYFVKAGALTKLLVGPYGSRAEAAAGCRGVNPCVPVAR
ncbi:MAG: SPOR domain-containing protein [Sphingomonas sp.]|uniref:SPOR domain-containing protein n=1 Tax=Sphingomonas sp. TaxID=28214 RepID=UPI001B2557CF|nr:SPOR domain-containing protein [Sphingomonas sp.]MBO9624655.1 SPOR domain-containing protein [Sphingomonas sp.]